MCRNPQYFWHIGGLRGIDAGMKAVEFDYTPTRSFLTRDSKAITLPSQVFKELRKDIKDESTLVNVTCGNFSTKGSIYWGVRDGSPYYQLRMRPKAVQGFFEKISIGSKLKVKIMKESSSWEISIQKA
jgi:hypothetical protein